MCSGSIPSFHFQILVETGEGSEMLHVAKVARLKRSKTIPAIAKDLGMLALKNDHYYILPSWFICLRFLIWFFYFLFIKLRGKEEEFGYIWHFPYLIFL